jgi:hypothetical protein
VRILSEKISPLLSRITVSYTRDIHKVIKVRSGELHLDKKLLKTRCALQRKSGWNRTNIGARHGNHGDAWHKRWASRSRQQPKGWKPKNLVKVLPY